ncbi:hypothetical protein DIPPA_19826 [Diplonema papillatum]|nr:hypothetical protein DIPPA_19826 [Diplonema papillatum]
MIARPYRILCSFFDACERLPRVYARMLNIARLYSRHGVLLPEARLGPVGIAISDGFTVAGIGFEGRDFATAALEGRRLLDMERGERHHAIRARLRQTTWTQLARQRPSYDDVQAGVDCRRTNELRLVTAAGRGRARGGGRGSVRGGERGGGGGGRSLGESDGLTGRKRRARRPTWDTYQPWPEKADDEIAPEARPPASRQEATRALHPHDLSRSRAARTTTTRRSRRRRHWPRRPEHSAPTRPRPALFDGRP